MSAINPYESSAETFARLFGDDHDAARPLTLEQGQAFLAAREEVSAAREAAQQSAAAPPPPPPSPEDQVGQLRAKAERLRREEQERAALRQDAETLALEEGRTRGYALNPDDVADMSDADLFRLTGLDGKRPQGELDNDLAANIEAAESGPATFEHVARERAEREIAADRERQASWGDFGAGEES